MSVARVLAKGRFGSDTAGYRQMLAEGRRFTESGVGGGGLQRHRQTPRAPAGCMTERRLFDVPPKLSAQVRVFATGNGRKTDPVDAHSVADGRAAHAGPGARAGR